MPKAYAENRTMEPRSEGSPPRPVRPKILDEASREDVAAAADGASARAPAAERAAPAPEEHSVPCGDCGYDLRACAPGSRCPECGAVVPAAAEDEPWGGSKWSFRDEIRAALRATPDAARDASAERRRRREEQLDAWSGLSTASLGAIALVSPVPFLGSVGLVATSALLFAPVFRLVHLRTLEAAPEPIVSRLRAELSGAWVANMVEIAAGAIVALSAVAATFATLPPRMQRLIPINIAVWWLFATLSLLRQIGLAEASNRLFTPPAEAPPEPPHRTRAFLIGGVGAAVVGVAVSMGAPLVAGALGGAPHAGIVAAGLLLAIGGMCLHAVGAVMAWRFLAATSRCAFESPVFRVLRTKAPERDALPEGVVRHAKTPDHGPPVVEVIELPPPSAEFLAGKDDGLEHDSNDGKPRDHDA